MDVIEREEILNDIRDKKVSQAMHGGNVSLTATGSTDSLDYRIRATDGSSTKQISLWHDVSLVHLDPVTRHPTPYLNYVNEIPKFSR
jgi:inorganic pyrophosphatase